MLIVSHPLQSLLLIQSALLVLTMAPPTPLHQSAVFYEGKWTKEVDLEFIDILVHECMKGHYRVGQNNYGAMRLAMTRLNAKFNGGFDLKFCWARFKKLKARYELFRWIIRLSGVTHDRMTNRVQCCVDGWEFICEKEPMARAYMLEGEKSWDGLLLLFHDGNNSEEFVQAVDSIEVIEVSSDHNDDASFVSPNAKAKEAQGGKEKEGCVIGKESKPDMEWWAEVALGDPAYFSDGEVSQPSEYSSTEPLKRREPIAVSSKLSRRLWADDGSSSASFLPKEEVMELVYDDILQPALLV